MSETAATDEARPWRGVCVRCGTAKQEPDICRLCDVVTLELPHPPASLSPNGRAHWRVKARDAAQVRQDAAMLVRQAIWEAGDVGHPWPAATMDIHWRFSGRQPDSDNTVSRCKNVRDGIADACLVSDDVSIRVGAVTFERVRRAEQCVVLTLTRREDER